MKPKPATSLTAAFADRPDANGITLLMEAAAHGVLDKIKECVKRGANINAIDHAGNNALMHAIGREKDPAPAVLLILYGIDTNYVRHDGCTALMLAAAAMSPETIERLLQKNVALDGQKKKDGNTALMVSALQDDGWAACRLLDAGADFDTLKNAKGQTALDLARQKMSAKNFDFFQQAVARRREQTAQAQHKTQTRHAAGIEQAVSDVTVLQHDVAPSKPVALRHKPR